VFGNSGLNYLARHVRSLDNDFVADHNRRCHRQIQFKIFIAQIFRYWLGRYLDIYFIFFTQPGYNFFKMLSWLAVWFIKKKPDFQHSFPPLRGRLKKDLKFRTPYLH